jgi:hypothetical protein
MDTTDHSATSVSAVYLAGDLVDPGDYTVNLTTGIVSIDAGVFDEDFDEVTIDFIGHNDDNALDIIKDLMLIYGEISFIATNFDITEWNTARAAAKQIGIFIDDDEKLIDVIGRIINSTDGIFFTKINGKYTARVFDEDRDITKTIQTYEFIGEPKIANNGSEFLTSAKVLYDQNLRTEKYKKYLNDDFEDAAFRQYKSYQQKTFPSLLTQRSDAVLKSNLMMSLSSSIKDVITRRVKMQHYDLEIGDFVLASPATRQTEDDDFSVYEIIGKNINPNTFEISLTMKFIKEFEETETVYTQGFLYFDKLYGDKLYGPTRLDEV